MTNHPTTAEIAALGDEALVEAFATALGDICLNGHLAAILDAPRYAALRAELLRRLTRAAAIERALGITRDETTP